MRRIYSTKLGAVYQADCLELLGSLKTASVHTVFSDPPFNLKNITAAMERTIVHRPTILHGVENG